MVSVHVATLNIRNLADRWDERLPLLLADMAALQPDVLGLRDVDGQPGCLDDIWVRGAIEVESCRLAFDRPAVGDPTLCPSDHLGLSARITVG